MGLKYIERNSSNVHLYLPSAFFSVSELESKHTSYYVGRILEEHTAIRCFLNTLQNFKNGFLTAQKWNLLCPILWNKMCCFGARSV